MAAAAPGATLGIAIRVAASASAHPVRGRLVTGRAAVGGETTGTAVTADGITWEVDFGGSEQLAARAGELAGRPVVIDGVLERAEGVEVPTRWIVHARTLEPAR